MYPSVILESDAPLDAAESAPVPRLRYSEGSHKLIFSEPEIISGFPDPLYLELIASPAFRRLRDVRFLGAIDFLVQPNGRPLQIRHTRYQHSICVGALALRYSQDNGWSQRAQRAFVSGALLHDVGHGPLSHSLERVFREEFEIDHHLATQEIIRQGIEGRHSLAEILRRHGVDPEQVIDMIDNEHGDCAPFFLGKFNVDTLDAITRSAMYLRKNSLDTPPYLVHLEQQSLGSRKSRPSHY